VANTSVAAMSVAVPIKNGTGTFVCPTSFAATDVAKPPPMKRTKPYVADETGGSTGVLMTPVVTPRNAPTQLAEGEVLGRRAPGVTALNPGVSGHAPTRSFLARPAATRARPACDAGRPPWTSSALPGRRCPSSL
jgi:hypothetical protein